MDRRGQWDTNRHWSNGEWIIAMLIGYCICLVTGAIIIMAQTSW